MDRETNLVTALGIFSLMKAKQYTHLARNLKNRILITGGSGFIGTNLIDWYLSEKIEFANVDKSRPKKDAHFPFWHKCDILDKNGLQALFNEFSPSTVIHLAAETDVHGDSLGCYSSNIEGMSNLVDVIAETKSVRRAIITSTQHVHQFHGIPQNDQEYFPLGLYGESKVLTEQITRSANLRCDWTIIRPTNIWGPWHNIYPTGLWRQMLAGRYLHPGKRTVIRSYGYVGNVVHQIERLRIADPSVTHKKVFYVGDEPIDLYTWVNAFSLELTGKNVKIAPRSAIRGLAYVGDLFHLMGIRFPLTSSRYRNMVIDNPCPMKETLDVTGPNPYSLVDGVRTTVDWYTNEYLKNNLR